MMLTGLGHDTLMNSLLFLAGVLPSHIHGFYISCTWFHRRKKARKGKYPGGRKSMIYSQDLLDGGLTPLELERRWWIEKGGDEKRRSKGSKRESTRRRKSARISRNEGSGIGSQESRWRSDVEQEWLARRSVGDTNKREGHRRDMDTRMIEEAPHTHRIQAWRNRVTTYDDEMMPALPPRPGIG